MNLESTILPHSIVENNEVECDRTLLEDNNMISQVRIYYVIYLLIKSKDELQYFYKHFFEI